MNIRALTLVCVFSFTALTAARSASAYTDEVHYGVTYALAVAAGWSEADAHVIASATYAPDENHDFEATVTLGAAGDDAHGGPLMDVYRRIASEGQNDFRLNEIFGDKAGLAKTGAAIAFDPLVDPEVPHDERPLGTDTLVESPTNHPFHCMSRDRDTRALGIEGKGGLPGRVGLQQRIDDFEKGAAHGRAQDVSRRLAVMLREVERLGKGETPRDRTLGLVSIGVFLHCQQDSWSHSGWGGLSRYFGHFFEYVHDGATWAAWQETAKGSPLNALLKWVTAGAQYSSEAMPTAYASNREVMDAGLVEVWLKGLEGPQSRRDFEGTLFEIFSYFGKTYSGLLVNGDHPGVRPGQLRGSMLETYWVLREVWEEWNELQGDPPVSPAELEVLHGGVSNPIGLSMNPLLGKRRPQCIEDVVRHWMFIQYKAGRLPLKQIGAPGVRPFPKSSVALERSCEDLFASWRKGQDAETAGMIVLPKPKYPILIMDESHEIDYEAIRTKVILEDGDYRSTPEPASS